MYDQMTEEAKKEDLNFNLNNIKKTPNTVFSHSINKLAEQSNVHNEVKEKIYHSYFIEGLDIGNKEILINIATEFNIKESEVNNFFNQTMLKKLILILVLQKKKKLMVSLSLKLEKMLFQELKVLQT